MATSFFYSTMPSLHWKDSITSDRLSKKELRKRDLNFEPYTESDVDSQPSSEPSTIHHASRPTTIPTVNMTPYIPDSQTTATANISFVDASILSKLDLPLFEGNLLEFPEY
ncbi:hypothetical protein RB195_013700 [Necator americanus]|uniref:Uncharacterized protein n=1 Tax=Necator americanus TaxID=51031 RepID=A0ABR1DWS2_NECAM